MYFTPQNPRLVQCKIAVSVCVCVLCGYLFSGTRRPLVPATWRIPGPVSCRTSARATGTSRRRWQRLHNLSLLCSFKLPKNVDEPGIGLAGGPFPRPEKRATGRARLKLSAARSCPLPGKVLRSPIELLRWERRPGEAMLGMAGFGESDLARGSGFHVAQADISLVLELTVIHSFQEGSSLQVPAGRKHGVSSPERRGQISDGLGGKRDGKRALPLLALFPFLPSSWLPLHQEFLATSPN